MADHPGSPPKQQQEPPGHTGEMMPKPDHGEHSYRGCGKLTGKKALITGAVSGMSDATGGLMDWGAHPSGRGVANPMR